MSSDRLLKDKCPSCGAEIILVPSTYFKHRVVGYCRCTSTGAVVEKDKASVPKSSGSTFTRAPKNPPNPLPGGEG